jgi:hypothetical protein
MASLVGSRENKSSMWTIKNQVGPQNHITAAQYREMSDALLRLCIHSYSEYLASDLWDRIRSQVLARDGGKCKSCGKPANQVHHSQYNYETLAGISLIHLQAVCRKCHFSSHSQRRARRIRPTENQPCRVYLDTQKSKCPFCGCRKKTPTACAACKKKGKGAPRRTRSGK